MASATLQRAPALPTRIQVALVGLLLVLAGARLGADRRSHGGMDAGPGTDLGGLGWFVGIWVTMMAAMMLPSITPMVVAHARSGPGRRARPRSGRRVFVAGYLRGVGCRWTARLRDRRRRARAGSGRARLGRAGALRRGRSDPRGALYQLSPLKDGCLRQCRSPKMLLGTGAPVTSGRCGWGSSTAGSASAAAGR